MTRIAASARVIDLHNNTDPIWGLKRGLCPDLAKQQWGGESYDSSTNSF